MPPQLLPSPSLFCDSQSLLQHSLTPVPSEGQEPIICTVLDALFDEFRDGRATFVYYTDTPLFRAAVAQFLSKLLDIPIHSEQIKVASVKPDAAEQTVVAWHVQGISAEQYSQCMQAVNDPTADFELYFQLHRVCQTTAQSWRSFVPFDGARHTSITISPSADGEEWNHDIGGPMQEDSTLAKAGHRGAADRLRGRGLQAAPVPGFGSETALGVGSVPQLSMRRSSSLAVARVLTPSRRSPPARPMSPSLESRFGRTMMQQKAIIGGRQQPAQPAAASPLPGPSNGLDGPRRGSSVLTPVCLTRTGPAPAPGLSPRLLGVGDIQAAMTPGTMEGASVTTFSLWQSTGRDQVAASTTTSPSPWPSSGALLHEPLPFRPYERHLRPHTERRVRSASSIPRAIAGEIPLHHTSSNVFTRTPIQGQAMAKSMG